MEEPVIRMPEGLRDRVVTEFLRYDRIWEQVQAYCNQELFLAKRECLRVILAHELLQRGEIKYREFAEELSETCGQAIEVKSYNAAFCDLSDLLEF